MPEPGLRAGLLRRALDAQLTYYAAVSRVTMEYLEAIAGLAGDITVPINLGDHTILVPSERADAAAPTARRPPASSPAQTQASPPPPALVLEAPAGACAVGVFLVENLRAECVSGPVEVSGFTSADGRAVESSLLLDPAVVSLEAGEQVLVGVTATISDELEPGVSYRGMLSVPGLAGGGMPIVIRRHEHGENGSGPQQTQQRASP